MLDIALHEVVEKIITHRIAAAVCAKFGSECDTTNQEKQGHESVHSEGEHWVDHESFIELDSEEVDEA